MAKKNTNTPKRPTPPKGMIDAADDLMLDMERAGPDPDEMVFRVNPDGSITKFPATELPKEDQ
jgi:hypothetical protein